MDNNRNDYIQMYKIIKYLIDNKILKRNFYDLCFTEFNFDYKYVNPIKSLLNNIIHCDDDIYLSQKTVDCYEKIPYFLAHFYSLKSLDIEDLLFKLELYCNKCDDEEKINEHYIYIISLVCAILYKDKACDDEYYIAMFLYNYLSFSNLLKKCREEKEILDIFKNKSIQDIVLDNNIAKIYTLNNILDVEQYFKSSLAYRIIPYIIDNISATKYINYLFKDSFNDFIRRMSLYFEFFTTREERIVRMRYGIDDNNPKSLEQTSRIFNMTKERVRQIENGAFSRILRPSKLLKDIEFYKIYFESFKKDQNFVEVEFLHKYFKGHEKTFIMFLDMLNIAKYNRQYDILIDYNQTIDVVINNILDSLDEIIPYQKCELLTNLEKNIINNYYKNNGNAYFKADLNKGKIVLSILSKHFNYEFNNKNNDLTEINKILIKDYYYNEQFDLRTFTSLISRYGYYSIGNGLFRHYEHFLEIPDELLIKIKDYIDGMGNAVLYSNIYHNFANELNELGINHSQYLKSIIDIVFKDEYRPTKDYLYKNDSNINAVDYMKMIFKSFNSPFEINDLYEKLPQYSKISIRLCLESEIKCDLIRLDNNKYVYINDVTIEPGVKDELLSLLNEYINKKNGIISINNLYVDIYYSNPQLLSKLGVFNQAFGLFSVMKYWFSNEYNFHRPLIYDKAHQYITVMTAITNKLKTKDEISFDDIRNELNDLELNHGYKRDDFIDTFSDNFMLVDMNRFINRNVYSLSSLMLADIKLILNLYLKKEKELDTTKFKAYDLFPKLKYRWNKYLLIGILKCYFPTDYQIDYSGTQKDYDFVIRRLADE